MADLLEGLKTHEAVHQVLVLAALDPSPGSSLDAMAKHLTTAESTARVLQEELVLASFASLQEEDSAAAQEILQGVRAALAADELQTPLGPRLRELALAAQRLRATAAPAASTSASTSAAAATAAAPRKPAALAGGFTVVVESAGDSLASFDEDRRRAEAALQKAGPGARIELTYSLRVVKPQR